MPFFQKKPVAIEAMQFTDNAAAMGILRWMGGGRQWDVLMDEHEANIVGIPIPTLEGEMIASLNDWIIKGVKGEFYPCKPDIFELSYESF